MSSDKPLSGYSQLWGAIIRPPRQRYDVSDLGPITFALMGREYRRTDLELINVRGQTLKCSHFEPEESTRVADMLPCVIYLHGNCSSRLESLEVLEVLLPLNITVFAFDFSGSGMSDGDYISLGWFEKDDLAMVVEHLKYSGKTNHIGLWGRSMGAVTAMLYTPLDPSLAGVVFDSPFSSLPDLAQELASSHSSVPSFLVSAGLSFVRGSIKKRIGLDINDLKPVHFAPQCQVPALFIGAEQDELVRPYHTRLLYSAYGGRKKLVMVQGEHNGPRPQVAVDQVQKFFCQVLRCHSLPSTRSPTSSGLTFHTFKAANPGHALRESFSQIARDADVNDLLAAMLEEIRELRDPESVDLLGLGNASPSSSNRPQEAALRASNSNRPDSTPRRAPNDSTNLLDL